MKPIVIISSWPPRFCGIATFAEEAREFIQKHNPNRKVYVISHTDGAGEGVFPLIDMTRHNWWEPVEKKIRKLDPYAVHIEHEYGLYEYHDERGFGDSNAGFLTLLEAINDYPIVVEPHTVHGRLRDVEANFIYQMCKLSDVVLFKCAYQKWRLHWTFDGFGWPMPSNIMVVPHGARPDRRSSLEMIPATKAELGLDKIPRLGPHLVGLIGWIQSNKRWDILISMWEGIAKEIEVRTGEEWDLLVAGAMRDDNDLKNYEKYKNGVKQLEVEGLGYYFEFVPRGEIYYKVMSVCDFIVLPSLDETQSGTLARIIALNKPYITTAPMEGLTSQTLESEGGLMFTTKKMLREKILRMACSEKLRSDLSGKLKHYLDEVVSWNVVARQYNEAYKLAHKAKQTGKPVELSTEFE